MYIRTALRAKGVCRYSLNEFHIAAGNVENQNLPADFCQGICKIASRMVRSVARTAARAHTDFTDRLPDIRGVYHIYLVKPEVICQQG